jgi:capsular exopolysaccharide synthesis family protein
MSTEQTSFGDNAAHSDMVDLRGILLLLRRQIRLIALTAAVILGLALTYLITATPMYTARTLLMVDPSQRNLLDSDQFGGANSQVDNAKIDSEVEILRSPSTALAVIEAANLSTDPEFGPSVGFTTRIKIALGLQSDAPPSQDDVLQGMIQRVNNALAVRRMGLTYLISVEITSTNPQSAANIANVVAQSYIRNQVQGKIAASLSARDILQTQADAGRDAVAASDAALDSFIEDNLATLEADSGNPRIAELRASLESQRDQLLSQEVALSTATSGLQDRNFAALADSLADEALQELLAQREAIAAQLQEVAEGDQTALDLQQELAQLDGAITDGATAAIATLRSNVSAENSRLGELRTELRTTLLQSDLSSDALAQIFELQQAAAIARSQYQNVLARLSEIENQAAVQVAQSRVVSEALPPSGKSAPNTRLILALGLVMGIGLGIGFAFLNEYYIGGVISPAQLEQLTGLQVATVVPKMPDAVSALKNVASTIVNEPLSTYSESVRRLRAVLDQDLRQKWRDRKSPIEDARSNMPMRQGSVIMVTSSVPAEGKSTLSLSLARVYAMSNLKVVVVDADLRKPSIAEQLNIEPEVGLLDFLINPGEEDVATRFSIAADPLTKLHCVLGTGRAKVPTDQLISSPGFGSLLEKLRLNYDIIVVDTSPLLPVVDARYVAHHADAIVLPVRWAATSQGDLRAALSVLKPALGANVDIHLVLNQNEQSTGGYGYGYRYGSYYGDE